MTIDGYILQVQGYASAVGSASLNQKLSMERADNVLTFLDQEGKVPNPLGLQSSLLSLPDRSLPLLPRRSADHVDHPHQA